MSNSKDISGKENPIRNYHVAPKGNKKREVKKEKEGNGRFFDSKELAIHEGERLAKEEGVDLIIHAESGKVEERRTP